MSNTANPFEIARDALKQLAQRRIAPTPDNYQLLYHEIAGTKPKGKDFPEKHLRTLAAALPKSSPDQMRLARQLDEAVRAEDWDAYQKHLITFIGGLIESQKLAWGELIGDLLRQWEAKHQGVTSARKRESLEHVLNGSANNPDNLFSRLQSLMRSWGSGREADRSQEAEPADSELPVAAGTVSTSDDPTLLNELRELFAFTLETAISSQLIDTPQLAEDAKALASKIRRTRKADDLQDFLANLKRFTFKLELLGEDQQELRKSLLGLLRLLVENMTELVIDDQWLHGQIEVVREVIDKPLSQRSIDDAERRLKEVLFKQSQLKTSLFEAREAIKHMLTGFVDHLADFTGATSEYHDKIEQFAGQISAANDISQLETVLQDVMRETRNIQINAQRSRDELRSTEEKVREAEARIRQLEGELEQTSHLVRHDQLTGLLNRHGLEEMFDKESARARRHDTILCVGLLDIDNFKKLNDSLGHDAGDQALVHLATVCRETLRPQDSIARFGGEEFIIILPETPLDDAVKALTRLQRELTKRFFLHDNEKVLITFSAGVTEMGTNEDQASVIKRADEAMYEAKQTGKNRVISR
jgi:diguanylate cyclase